MFWRHQVSYVGAEHTRIGTETLNIVRPCYGDPPLIKRIRRKAAVVVEGVKRPCKRDLSFMVDALGQSCGPFGSTQRGKKQARDRKSTRLNSSHGYISYAV